MQETQETQVQSLGQEDPLEKRMATHYSILVWSIAWTEEPGPSCESFLSDHIQNGLDLEGGCLWSVIQERCRLSPLSTFTAGPSLYRVPLLPLLPPQTV